MVLARSALPSSTLHPNWQYPSTWLTLGRLLAVPVLPVVLWLDPGPVGRLVALVLFVLAAITDRLDGQLARQRGEVTDFGKRADPLADKALVTVTLLSLNWLGLLPWWVTAIIVARELAVTLWRRRLQRQGRGVVSARLLGKVKMVAQSIALGAYLLPVEAWWSTPLPELLRWPLLAIALILTAWSGWDAFVHVQQPASDQ